jgi:uncharacterized protein YbjT (DUF2867 family)
MTVLVTGARGDVGAAVLAGLLAAGEPVRASSRAPRPGEFPAGVEVARADLADPASWPAALGGMRKVFLYAHPEGAAEFAAAARKAGVEHVVLLSSSVLRTAFPDAVTSPVDERDIAQVAVRALLDDRHRGAAYPVLGAGPVTVREQVAAIAAALGEPVRLEEVDVDTYRAQLPTQLPEPIVERVLQDRGSVPQLPAELATAVPEILGRPALTFAEWARDHAADFR